MIPNPPSPKFTRQRFDTKVNIITAFSMDLNRNDEDGQGDVVEQTQTAAFVEIHPDDAAQLGVVNGTLVKVGSRRGFAIYPATITARGCPGH